jgi:hypothetical protein
MRTGTRGAAAEIEAPGVYVELHSAQNTDISHVQWEQKGIRIGALKLNEEGVQSAALFVPNQASGFLEEKLADYGKAVQGENRPANEAKVGVIETISVASLQTLWTDFRALPEDADESVWWGLQNGGETCVIDLSGLAAKTLHVPIDRKQFRNERIGVICDKLRKHQPRLVVMYGKGEKQCWQQIAAAGLKPEQPYRVGSTIFVMTTHPNTHGRYRCRLDGLRRAAPRS